MNMREVILLDNESTMALDLFCNKAFITGVHKTKETITVQSNGGTLVAKKKATLKGYKFDVWFDKRAITNVLWLANISKQYRVTYDSGNSKGFVVHRATTGLPDMYFKLHESGLHVYNPKLERVSFLNTIKDNTEGFTK
jgi:hypothetical protein